MFPNFKLIKNLFLLKPEAINTIASNKSATIDGILLLFLGNLGSVIGVSKIVQQNPEIFTGVNLEFDLSFVLSTSIIALFFAFILINFSYFIAYSLGGKTKLSNYFRVTAFVQVINLLNLFPELGFLTMWGFVIQFQILKDLNKLSSLNAFLTIISTLLALFAILSTLS